MVSLLYQKSKEFLDSLINEGKITPQLEALKNHHLESYEHSMRVGLLSVDLGLENHVNDFELRLLGYSGLLHDVGKVKIPLEILSKTEKLTSEELEVIKSHSRLGFLEIDDELEYGLIKPIIVAHHEYKKEGYPRKGRDRRKKARNKDRRKRKADINKLAEIIAVADMYDALTSSRSYKIALPKEEVEKILKTQYTGSTKYVEQVLDRN
ncbi:HD domain-containing protein [Candidatus Woesearchaeota archaeon]|nr:HD domain-containing protein [Candidatus Woesearchaeota archaeon]